MLTKIRCDVIGQEATTEFENLQAHVESLQLVGSESLEESFEALFFSVKEIAEEFERQVVCVPDSDLGLTTLFERSSFGAEHARKHIRLLHHVLPVSSHVLLAVKDEGDVTRGADTDARKQQKLVVVAELAVTCVESVQTVPTLRVSLFRLQMSPHHVQRMQARDELEVT